VASGLLKVGVASVVAMSHSVLVATATRFVAAFYAGLAAGERVGDAMLAGQRGLKDDDLRGQVFGTGELQLQDWFVPVLFQEQYDPRLFIKPLGDRTYRTWKDIATLLENRLGALPELPATGFVGHSRELLTRERLLGREPYAKFRDREQAILPIERALVEQPTLLALDNLETILPPPYLPGGDPTGPRRRGTPGAGGHSGTLQTTQRQRPDPAGFHQSGRTTGALCR